MEDLEKKFFYMYLEKLCHKMIQDFQINDFSIAEKFIKMVIEIF